MVDALQIIETGVPPPEEFREEFGGCINYNSLKK